MVPDGLKRLPKAALWGVLALGIALIVAVVLVAGGSSKKPAPQSAKRPAYVKQHPVPAPASKGQHKPVKAVFTGSGLPNGDVANTRRTSSTITSANVKRLAQVWSSPLAGSGYAASPIISHGVVYSEDLGSNVQALSLETGKELWNNPYNVADNGPNGLAVGGGLVYGATDQQAFALDEKTGKEVWSTKLVRNVHEGIDMAPGYHDGLVYVSTVPVTVKELYPGGAVGVLWALNAKTGKKVWKFVTAQVSRWSSSHQDINSGGGLWYTPAFDRQGGMYIGVGNPGPFPPSPQYPWGSSRPGPNLYTNSLVKLDAKTGKMKWYYQLTPHDLYDWDLQDPPILANAKGRPAVIGAGKAGIVIAVDRSTGKLLWKRPVGTHNGHDKDGLYAMKHRLSKLQTPMEVYPGMYGGVIAPMSTSGKLVFAPVVNMPLEVASPIQMQPGQNASGEVVAVDVDTGKVKWDQSFPTPVYGSTTVVNDLVFATTYDGGLHALSVKTGKVVWETQLPTGTNAGVAVHGDTVIAPAAVGQSPAIYAYRLP